MVKKIVIITQIEGLIIIVLVFLFYQGKISQQNFAIALLTTILIFSVLLIYNIRGKRIEPQSSSPQQNPIRPNNRQLICRHCGQEFSYLEQIKLFLLYYKSGVYIGWCGKCCEKDYKSQFSQNILFTVLTGIGGAIFFAWLLFYMYGSKY